MGPHRGFVGRMRQVLGLFVGLVSRFLRLFVAFVGQYGQLASFGYLSFGTISTRGCTLYRRRDLFDSTGDR